MPLLNNPILDTKALELAVTNTLVKSGILPSKQEFHEHLAANNITLETLAIQLADVILNSKDSVKLKAIMGVLATYGITMNPEAPTPAVPQIVFNVQGENIQLNSLFAPERKF